MLLKIFYSWQTETNKKYNKNFIDECIRKAVRDIESNPRAELFDVTYIVQQGIDGEPGRPPVAGKIRDERIPMCDIFIGDYSIVDPLTWYDKLFRRKKNRRRTHHNDNVIQEYGIAYNSIGCEQLILVMNSTYGSVKADPNNINFDIRDERFPIEYSYSALKSKKDAKNKLVAELKGAIELCSIAAIRNTKNKMAPFISWGDHASMISNLEHFIKNESIDKSIQSIKYTDRDIRFLGLSGLGKTRIVFESFRNNDASVNPAYLYCSYQAYLESNIIETLKRLYADNQRWIIVLDNCPLSFYKHILGLKKQITTETRLITIFNDPEEYSLDQAKDTDYIFISKKDTVSVVDTILNESFAMLTEGEIQIIKEFSNGIPLMAVLLADSARNGERYIGRLTDKELLDKLLSLTSNNNDRVILQACALFEVIGFEEEYRGEVEFIAKNKHITSLNGDDDVIIQEFDRVILKYLKKEIFEQIGRFVGMRPKPLALALAVEWLEQCTSSRLLSVINDIQASDNPHRVSLTESLSKQFKYLGYSDKATDIVSKLTGELGPFDNAEVINTDLGSRLFRSFVEVNPVAVAENLARNFGPLSTDELRNIKVGRRNLIWALEVLLFDERTYEKSAKLLMQFAIAENENIGNNATGQILHSFHIHLSGTEVNLQRRITIIRWALENGKEFRDLAYRASNSALESNHFIRFTGPEKQGTKLLKDYQPTVSEIIDYWAAILEILSNAVENDHEFTEICCKYVADNIRGICRVNGARIILPIIERIAIYRNNDWDDALKMLHYVNQYDLKFLAPEEKDHVKILIERLTKTDFISRFLDVNDKVRREQKLSDNEKILECQKIEYTNLASEFVENELFVDLDLLKELYYPRQLFSSVFGNQIAELMETNTVRIRLFIESSIQVISVLDIKDFDPSIFIGFAQGLKVPEHIDCLIGSIKNNNKVNYLLFPILGSLAHERDDIELLFDLIDKRNVSVSYFNSYFHYKRMPYDLSKLYLLLYRIIEYGKDGIETVINQIQNLLYFSEQWDPELLKVLDHAIRKVHYDEIRNLYRDKYFQACEMVLKGTGKKESAIHINQQLIKSLNSRDYMFSYEHDYKKVYAILMGEYFDVIWNELSKALLSDGNEYIVFYNLKNIIGSDIAGISRGLLTEDMSSRITKWCEENINAPVRLAYMLPFFSNNGIDNYSLYLLDKHGDNKEILDILGGHIHSYSWTGSLIPLYKHRIEILTPLLKHKNIQVSKWAESNISTFKNNIVKQQQREAEDLIR